MAADPFLGRRGGGIKLRKNLACLLQALPIVSIPFFASVPPYRMGGELQKIGCRENGLIHAL